MAADVLQATQHQAITPGAGLLNPIPSMLFVNTDGTVAVTMASPITGNEVSVTYNVLAGAILPVRPLRITAATAAIIGLY